MQKEMFRKIIHASAAGIGTIVLACGLYSTYTLVEDIHYEHYRQQGGDYVDSFTKNPSTLQYFDQEWKALPDGVYLLVDTPMLPAKGANMPPFSIVKEEYGSLVYCPLDLKQPEGFQNAFHGNYLEYGWGEVNKKNTAVPPYYLLYVQNGYGEIVRSFDYPSAWYEAYRSIRQGNFRLRDRLLYDYLAPTLLNPPSEKGTYHYED